MLDHGNWIGFSMTTLNMTEPPHPQAFSNPTSEGRERSSVQDRGAGGTRTSEGRMQKTVRSVFQNGYIFPILCSVILLAHCIYISHYKYMWMDEILTYYPSSYHSFRDMLSFMADKINASNFLYFIFTWSWAKLFSTSELSLRLFSSIAFCVAATFIWATLRRVYGVWSASIVVILIFLNSPLIIYQNSEARFYGMFLALTASLFYLTIKNLSERRLRWPLSLSLFIVNGFLPLIHPFGFAYSLLFLMAVAIVDWKNGQLRWKYYGMSLAGWLLFVPFIPAFRTAMDLSKPHFWIPRPRPEDLKNYYLGEESKVMMMFVGIVVVLLLWRLAAEWQTDRPARDFPALLLGILFILLPLVTWIYSQFFSSLFLSRYLIIYQLGLAILMAAVFSRVLPSDGQMDRSSKGFLTCVIGIMCALSANGLFGNAVAYPPPGSEDAELPEGLPIVADTPHIYLPRVHYNPAKRDYYFPLDWEVALRPGNTLNASQDFKVMQALKHHLPEQHIMATEEFLNTFSEFIVLPSRSWLNTRIASNSAYTMEQIRPGVFLVEKKPKTVP
jgi:hypothetical protein